MITNRHVDFYEHYFPFLERHNEIEFNDFKFEVFHLLNIFSSIVNPYALELLQPIQSEPSLSCDSTISLMFDLSPSLPILVEHSYVFFLYTIIFSYHFFTSFTTWYLRIPYVGTIA